MIYATKPERPWQNRDSARPIPRVVGEHLDSIDGDDGQHGELQESHNDAFESNESVLGAEYGRDENEDAG